MKYQLDYEEQTYHMKSKPSVEIVKRKYWDWENKYRVMYQVYENGHLISSGKTQKEALKHYEDRNRRIKKMLHYIKKKEKEVLS